MAASIEPDPTGRKLGQDGEEPRDAGAPSASRPRRRKRKRAPSGKLFVYADTKPGRGRYLDMRVRRRDGPLCETCGRKHYPFQGCWTGPKSVKRHGLWAENRKKREEAELRRKVNERGPEWVGPPPQRAGARLISGPGAPSVRRGSLHR